MSDDSGCAVVGIIGLVVLAAVVYASVTGSENRQNGRYQERCEALGGFWLGDSIAVGGMQTRCIRIAEPIKLVGTEQAKP